MFSDFGYNLSGGMRSVHSYTSSPHTSGGSKLAISLMTQNTWEAKICAYDQ